MHDKIIDYIENKEGDNFKQTEIGLIPEDWEVVKLKEITDRLVQGKILPTWEIKECDKFPVYGANGIIGYYNWAFVPANKVLITCRGSTCGTVNYTCKKAFVTNNSMILYENTSKVLWEYLYFTLQLFSTSSLKSGSGQPQITKGILIDFKIPLPTILEQQKIARVLSKIQQAIEQQDKIIEAIKNLKKSLMHKLFTEGLGHEGFKKTEIGEIPKSWDVVKLGESVDLQYGYTASAQEQDTGMKFLRITDIKRNGYINWLGVPYCEIDEKNLKKYRLKNGDILFARIGATTGKTCFIDNPPKSVFASYLIRFKPKMEEINTKFIYYYTQSAIYWLQVNANKEGKLKKGLSASVLKNFPIPLPPLPEQKQIAHILSTVDNKIEVEESRKSILKELFKTMLHKLMTGEIRLKDINI